MAKYRAQRTEYNGVKYASRLEARRAEELDHAMSAGRCAWWIGQPKFRLGCPENVYVADFLVAEVFLTDAYGSLYALRVEEVKGHETVAWKKNKRLWARYGPLPLDILKWNKDGWQTETIEPCSEK